MPDQGIKLVLNDAIALPEDLAQFTAERVARDFLRGDPFNNMDERGLSHRLSARIDLVPENAGEDEAACGQKRYPAHRI